uniref:Uncharacterized protein n=1 Tax=Myoviridae sp. ct3mI7 TaxID=2825028 RepID=A0A8S5QJ44_9CAUD|nr:MAG TPA: hypothetical protein [Myoviridae sp. ct3mI7]
MPEMRGSNISRRGVKRALRYRNLSWTFQARSVSIILISFA